MKKISKYAKNKSAQGTKPCRVAYSLNDDQPVRCSFISDQPLFYTDFEGDMEEDLMHDSASFEIFDRLHKIETGMDDLSGRLSGLASEHVEQEQAQQEVFQEFLADGDFVTRPFEAINHKKPDPAQLYQILLKSRLGSAYLDAAAQYGTEIHYNDQIITAHYDRKSGRIDINPHLGEADRILLAARELRRMWQHRNGALLHPLTFHPDQAVLVNRAQIADQAVAMVRLAWELQLADEKAAWERLERSPMEDLAHAFAREAYLDFRTLNNGIAAGAVFESWFLSERCQQQDKRLIQLMLADYQGYVFEGEQMSRTISAELLVALGSVPFGKNYLAPFVSTITTDPVFTEIRDRSSANFLWFIKFERSFREAEQELQSHEDNAGDVRDQPSKNNKKWLGKNENEKIITLYGGDGSSASIGHQTVCYGSVSGSGARIIPLGRSGSPDSSGGDL